MRRHALLLACASAALGCSGSIDGADEQQRGQPGRMPATGITMGGTGGSPVSTSGPGGSPQQPMGSSGSPGTPDSPFAFGCADPVAGERRPMRRLSRDEMRKHLVNVLSGTSLGSGATGKVELALSPVPIDSGDSNHFAEEKLDVTDGHLGALLSAAETLAATVGGLPVADHDLLSGARCKAPLVMDVCARGLADELGLRFFRRPATEAEIGKLREYLTMSAPTTTAAAVSGAFAYLFLLPASMVHLEDGGELVRAGAGVRITPFEAINRIYFGLLGGPPPVSVLKSVRAADWTRARAEQSIEEILKTAGFSTRVLDFFEEWLGYGPGVDLTHLPARMTTGLVTKEIPADAYEEMRAFVKATVFASSGSTMTDLLLSSDSHWSSANLAKIYGVPAPPAKGPVKTTMDPQRYAGLLSRVAMNLHNESLTSPIARGVRVKRKLLCEEIEVPPGLDIPAAEPADVGDAAKLSNRALVEGKTSPPICQGCHKSINNIGFALDFYDSLGRYRTEELRYDARGNVIATFPLATDVGGPLPVAREIAASERGSACFVSQWRSFTAQEDKHATNSCLKRTLHASARKGGMGLLEMFRQSARAELEAVKNLKGAP